jgi:Ca2+-transporting ATPase
MAVCASAAETVPACGLELGGSCDFTPPSVEGLCGAGSSGCPRYDQVNNDYNQLYTDWEKAESRAKEEISSMVFNTFIWCQMFNMLNARKIENEYNVFNGLFKSHVFWVIWVAIAGFQVIIMFFLGGIFKVERLTGLEWLVSILAGVGSLPVCLLTKVATK